MSRHRLFARSPKLPPSRGRLRAVFAAGASLVLLLAPMTATGQSAPAPPPDPAPAATTSAPPAADSAMARADTLFREGFALLQTRSFAAALAKFQESQKLDPAPGTMFNIATCEEGLGRFASAARAWREGFALLPADDTRRADAEKSAKAADGKAGRLVLRIGPQAPPGTTVSLAGRTLAANELATILVTDPGTHSIVVSAPGYQSRELTATTVSGETKELALAPGLPVTAPTTPAASTVSAPRTATLPPSAQPGFVAQHKISLALLGAGVAVAAVGAGVAVNIIDGRYSDFVQKCPSPAVCPPGEKEAMDGQATAVNVLFGVAGAAGLAAVGVFFFGEGGLTGQPSGTQMALAVGPGGLSLTVRR